MAPRRTAGTPATSQPPGTSTPRSPTSISTGPPTSSLDAGGDALFNAAGNLGTDPAAVNGYLNESVNDFTAANDAMWQSMGFAGTPDFGVQY